MSFQHDGWTRIMSNIIKKNLLDVPSAVCLGRWRQQMEGQVG